MILPTLHWGPAAAIAQLHAIVKAAGDENIVLIGSSLGGYYATYLADYYGLPAALINPAAYCYPAAHFGTGRTAHSAAQATREYPVVSGDR
jgi:uncharacterized protein